MSGVSLAVVWSDDQKQMGSLWYLELQSVAFVMLFSAVTLVPLLDLVFPALATAYLVLLSRLVFPEPPPTPQILESSAMLQLYAILGTVIGLFFPLAYVVGAYARGDELAVRWATPQLFLVSFQILTENLVTLLSLFSGPVRALVPTLYTVRRLLVISDWIQHLYSLDPHANMEDIAWHWFGITLAMTNLAFFTINMFAFLIPRFLPRAFEVYFKERYQTPHLPTHSNSKLNKFD